MLTTIMHKIEERGGMAYIVGGYVRDKLMGIESKDIDVEVFNMSVDELANVLAEHGRVSQVGASFGVLKVRVGEQDYDFSLPRRDSKVGNGHRGFIVEHDPAMTLEEAASRRDFTMNALSMDVDGNIQDFHDGQLDIAARILCHTSSAFSEDPLRVLRGMQFAGRFDMCMSYETVELCRAMYDEFNELATERVWEEWWKWACKSTVPSEGMMVLADTQWVKHFPNLYALVECEQDEMWHPEGDVWMHTLHVCDEAANIARREKLSEYDTGVLVLAALCHDMGKPDTSEVNDEGRIVSPRHANTSHGTDFLENIGAPKAIVSRVGEMVREHMVHLNPPNRRSVRRLIARTEHANVKDVVMLIEADHSGRPPLPKVLPDNAARILELSNEIGNEVRPLLMGRHLIDMGMEPGREFGNILREAFEAQLDGAFQTEEEAISWAKPTTDT